MRLVIKQIQILWPQSYLNLQSTLIQFNGPTVGLSVSLSVYHLVLCSSFIDGNVWSPIYRTKQIHYMWSVSASELFKYPSSPGLFSRFGRCKCSSACPYSFFCTHYCCAQPLQGNWIALKECYALNVHHQFTQKILKSSFWSLIIDLQWTVLYTGCCCCCLTLLFGTATLLPHFSKGSSNSSKQTTKY